jgi:hypothetical protein
MGSSTNLLEDCCFPGKVIDPGVIIEIGDMSEVGDSLLGW